MAALRESPLPACELIPLRRLTGRELDPILLEETVEWENELDWDFSRSADLIRQYADMRALNGFALLDRGEVAGYGYGVVEEHKGLVGDVYLRPAWRTVDSSVALLRAVLDSLARNAQVRRIESQLMLGDIEAGRRLERENRLRTFERLLMVRRTPRGRLLPSPHESLPKAPRPDGLVCEPWSDKWLELAAETMTLAYQNHVDSLINDQYRSVWGSRRFLSNIVQYPGCGTFFRPGSLIAYDPADRSVAGMVLTSFVSQRAGHVTQLCVAPNRQGAGLGYELLRRSVSSLAAGGAQMVSLTATCGNQSAIQLYQRCGFTERRRFLACAWDR